MARAGSPAYRLRTALRDHSTTLARQPDSLVVFVNAQHLAGEIFACGHTIDAERRYMACLRCAHCEGCCQCRATPPLSSHEAS